MRRREFITRLGAAGTYAAVPRLALAQQGTRVRRLAILVAGDDNQVTVTNYAMFRDELAKLGWVEGRNLQIDLRWGRGDVERMRANAAELVGLAPDVILAPGPAPTVRIVQRQTQTIPIVIAFANDVFASGLVKNLARPEGNITGVTNLFAPVAGKWVELLKEAVPRMERVGYVHPERQDLLSRYIEQASRVLGIQMSDIPFRKVEDLERGINAFAAEPNGGLVISVLDVYRTTISTLTIQYRLPTIIDTIRGGLWEGGLIFYGARDADIVVRSASFVDRILRGAKPADLPVEYPTRFELSVNLKTAKAIGVTIPEAFLARADELIE